MFKKGKPNCVKECGYTHVLIENADFFDFVMKYNTFFFDGMGGINLNNIDMCLEWDEIEDKQMYLKKIMVYIRIYLEERNKDQKKITTSKNGDK